ncbi:hypothetical protein AB1Y20_013967 [Prymnesium parvum]|uniref:Cytochrome b5 heme-binding domain-containing protein n=1 Tax=Prymnesium parvum TaxID=97485 RepID=A0AB34IEQ1_PRYPA|mmetsp:Transcript_17974/g.43003  ORF Transcript_17974/g.43003 Transcript_17974/m.43003 type:complete len:258 (-) Transcript_17974:500-1273(-)
MPLLSITWCAVALAWIFGGDSTEEGVASAPSCEPPPRLTKDGLRVFTPEEIAPYIGDKAQPKIYLSALGHVFDVTEGKQYYAPKRGYAHFAGRDASRSFATGVTAPDKLTDDLEGLNDEELDSVGSWYSFYDEHDVYKRIGRLEGRYYNHTTGEADVPFPWERLAAKKAKVKALKDLYPDCNSRWSQKDGSEVWCSTMSGGVKRDWVGVPRRFKPAGEERERCACVNTKSLKDPGLQEYKGCSSTAERCKVLQEDEK